jgi:hypothetical protein
MLLIPIDSLLEPIEVTAAPRLSRYLERLVFSHLLLEV